MTTCTKFAGECSLPIKCCILRQRLVNKRSDTGKRPYYNQQLPVSFDGCKDCRQGTYFTLLYGHLF